MIHVIDRYVEDRPNSKFGEVWHQLIVREVNATYDEWLGLISGHLVSSVRQFRSSPVCWQTDNESDSEFMLRASIEGFGPEFEDHLQLDDDWNAKILETVDLTTGVVWPNPPKADLRLCL